MATILHETPFNHPNDATTNFNVTIPAVAAGAKLVLVVNSNAVITAKLGGSGGTAFTKRATSVGAFELSCHDIVAVGGETVINVVMSGAGNADGVIFESMHFGAFMVASTKSSTYASTPNHVYEANVIVPTGPAVLFSSFLQPYIGTAPDAKLFGFGPAGRWAQNANNQGGSSGKFWGGVAVADISITTSFGFGQSPGNVKPSTSTVGIIALWSASWTYADSSGVPTVTWPNLTVRENGLPGDYFNTWQFSQTALPGTISGYTDKISVAPGDTVNLKVDSANAAHTATLYRAGFYGDDRFGARKILGITTTPAVQPAPTVDATGGHTTCAWTTTGTFTVPANATPGYYFVLLQRGTDFFQVPIIVRGAAKPSSTQIAMIAPVETWAAYNGWGTTTDTSIPSGRTVYDKDRDGNITHRCFAINFDKPMAPQIHTPATWWLDGEYALASFLEAQGYDVTYCTGLELEDTSYLTTAKIVALNGHHEYEAPAFRTALGNALAAGVNLFFNSANTFLWRIRWADASRRLAWCYKDSANTAGFDGATKYDPVSYTGTWRDTRTTAGGVNNPLRLPENIDSGLWFIGNGPTSMQMTVPGDTYKALPIWRSCPAVQALGAGATWTSSVNLIGYEFDYIKPGHAQNPTNMVTLSSTPAPLPGKAAHPDGYPYNQTDNTVVHNMVLWRHASGALVFNAGTWRWSWGLSRFRTNAYSTSVPVDVDVQQATLNIMRDLGAGLPNTPTTMRIGGTDTATVSPGAVAAPTSYGLAASTGGVGVVAQSGFFAVPV